MSQETLYLICYDIVKTNRRNKAAHLLEGYGLRVQKSVFECVLNKQQYEMIHRKLKQYIEPEEDQVRFYPMTVHTRRKAVVLGMQPEQQIDDMAFIV